MRSVVVVGLIAVAAAAVVALASACGGHDAQRDAVSVYVRAVNRLENRSFPAFRRADDALRSFGTTRAAASDKRRLTEAAVAIESAGAALRRITPPPDAARIHRDLLQLFEREAALTREVASMSAFLATRDRCSRARSRCDAAV
jgi:hypothetical protein